MSAFHLTAGFMPLSDALLLVLAHEKGFAEDEGLVLHLMRETSWANIRDRTALGHFDIAQMLAPMPIAANLGLTPLTVEIVVPFVMGLGNNGITVSDGLWALMEEQGAVANLDAATNGLALRKVVATGGRRLRFGVVHQTSSHNYELRYWLAACGIAPDADVEIVVVPPQYLPDAMGSGAIDGYCVGEPWNSFGVFHKGGRLVTVKHKVWRASPDKVIGMRADWGRDHPGAVSALIRALYKTGVWAGDASNHDEIASILARPAYLDAPKDIVIRGLSGRFDVGGGVVGIVTDHFIPSARSANFPFKSHALWYYSQMVRWGEAKHSSANASIAEACFRPDLFRDALRSLGLEQPVTDHKRDDGFFDGQAFDPQQLDAYIKAQDV